MSKRKQIIKEAEKALNCGYIYSQNGIDTSWKMNTKYRPISNNSGEKTNHKRLDKVDYLYNDAIHKTKQCFI